MTIIFIIHMLIGLYFTAYWAMQTIKDLKERDLYKEYDNDINKPRCQTFDEWKRKKNKK